MSDDSEKSAAEGYRQQIQEAKASESGFSAIPREELIEKITNDKALLKSIAQGYGFSEEDAKRAVDDYCKNVLKASSVGKYDDVNVHLILSRIINQIEEVCAKGKVPIHGGVVFGSEPALGLEASQSRVLATEVSIIALSMPFIPFCSLLSKAFTLCLPHTLIGTNYKVSNDPVEVETLLESTPSCISHWEDIISVYAVDGWPPKVNFQKFLGAQTITRIHLLQAMELFAVGHEYGHHVLKHGVVIDSPDGSNRLSDEHEADLFAIMVSRAIGSSEEPQNSYAMSGVGAVLMLGGIDFVRRARHILRTGSTDFPERNTHPPYKERVDTVAELDFLAPKDYARAFVDQRRCIFEVLEIIWSRIEPKFLRLHQEGVQPLDGGSSVEGWLPL